MITARKKRKKRSTSRGFPGLYLAVPSGCCRWLVLALLTSGQLVTSAGQELPGATSTTSYPTGPPCGNSSPHSCLAQASCSPFGFCQCRPGLLGDGVFQCTSAHSISAYISGTPPRLRTFQNISVPLYLTGRFRMTEFTTTHRDTGQTCQFQIFGETEIRDGVLALTGAEVHVQVQDDKRNLAGLGVRVRGRAERGTFTYTEWGRNGYLDELPVTSTDPLDVALDGSGSGDGSFQDQELEDEPNWGAPEELDLGAGKRVALIFDQDNFASVQAPSCGTTVNFRAPSAETGSGVVTPGLSVEVDEDIVLPTFQKSPTYLADTDSTSSLERQAKLKNVTVAMEVLHRMLFYAARQSSSPLGDDVRDTGWTYRTYCRTPGQQGAALIRCHPVLGDEAAFSCLESLTRDGEPSRSLAVFRLCLWAVCQPRPTVCSLLRSRAGDCDTLSPLEFSKLDCQN